MNRVHHRRDRGVAVIIFAITLSVLLAMSAFAVDVGQAYAERRHDQNTVDAAVMSGLVEGALSGGSVNDIVAEVRLKVDTTLGKTVTDKEWENCADDGALEYTTRDLEDANPTIDPVTDCISFSIAFDELRVRLPTQEVLGVFGPAVGFGNLKVDASANASIVNGTGTGGPPFVALATATTGDFVCLRTSSAKVPLPLANGNGPGEAAEFPQRDDPLARPDPCDATEFAAEGENFGTLKPWSYLKGCTRTGNEDVEAAISIGVDHIMGAFSHGYDPLASEDDPFYEEKTTVRLDGGPNQDCKVAYPNTFELDEGLNSGGLSCALVRNDDTLCNGFTPRFQQPGSFYESGTGAQVVGSSLDNVAPWEFLRDAEDLYQGVRADICESTPGECQSDEPAPNACVAVAASRSNDHFDLASSDIDEYGAEVADDDWDHYDRYDAFVDCLEQWDGATDPELFGENLGQSARFGFIPRVAEPSLSGIDYVHIEAFLPVFMYRIYIQHAGNPKAMCDPDDDRESDLKVHDAGQQHDCSSNNKTIDRLASLILSCGMVPDTLCNKATGEPASAGLDIYEFRLSK